MAEGHDSKQAREAFVAAEHNESASVAGAQQGTHDKSHAAHLEVEGNVHTSVAGDRKQGREPGTEIEPPQDPRTQGKAFHNRTR